MKSNVLLLLCLALVPNTVSSAQKEPKQSIEYNEQIAQWAPRHPWLFSTIYLDSLLIVSLSAGGLFNRLFLPYAQIGQNRKVKEFKELICMIGAIATTVFTYNSIHHSTVFGDIFDTTVGYDSTKAIAALSAVPTVSGFLLLTQ